MTEPSMYHSQGYNCAEAIIKSYNEEFNTNKVTNTQRMFSNMTNLKTIYVSDKFSLDKVTSSADMFLFCENLVGREGTKYSPTSNDKTYARIDSGEASPGYFTAK